jgi:hypothetical protein
VSPSEALDQQRALIDYLSTPQYQAFATGMLESQNAVSSIQFKHPRTGKADGTGWAYLESVTLRTAETFCVAADMVPLIEAASRGLDETDRFDHDLWPAEAGYCWFDRPLYMVDIRGRRNSIRAITWARRTPTNIRTSGMLVTYYSDADDMTDDITAEQWAKGIGDKARTACGRLHLFSTGWIADGQRVGPAEAPMMTEEEAAEYAARVQAVEGDFRRQLDAEHPIVRPSENSERLILALILLFGQEVTRTERVEADRPVARRAKRIGLPSRITVITLRRTAEDDTEYVGPRSVEWSRRWLVRGTWQWRHCGPNHPLAQPYKKGYRARVFIRGHLKGPAGKPLVITDRVYALRR